MFTLNLFILSTFLKSDLEVANFSKDELIAKLSQDHLFLLYVAVILSLKYCWYTKWSLELIINRNKWQVLNTLT